MILREGQGVPAARPRCAAPLGPPPLIGRQWCSSYRKYLMDSLRLLQKQCSCRCLGVCGRLPYRRAASSVESRKSDGVVSVV